MSASEPLRPHHIFRSRCSSCAWPGPTDEKHPCFGVDTKRSRRGVGLTLWSRSVLTICASQHASGLVCDFAVVPSGGWATDAASHWIVADALARRRRASWRMRSRCGGGRCIPEGESELMIPRMVFDRTSLPLT